ncbi:MAG: hypothetical protein A3F83_12555 [Candidatus Glassbacteria bacterium RIFCSPLOWO2_12_FULL_58_11]|uniref:Transcriptional regulator n=1 Tax=Candidatus Glassbacteria bacterium RIFCSPLOWO2_12_FULL_58_11 TaxID=1817867 RepID=A0A1F5Z0Q4_9BACT|nr:MAG: hypothetical protein A3F83_12555 [Candidatus Glassbacteria bacterium RIFCSPLOWO2_12_FULL_58_11]
MVTGISANTKQIAALVRKGEGSTLEFKRSTAELHGAMQSLCAFVNGSGGTVLIGVKPDGLLIGQDVSDATQQKIAAALDRFEPPAPVRMDFVAIGQDRYVIVMYVDAGSESVPFTYEGRAYERVGATTKKMPQSRYEQLLLERVHARRRWENIPAAGLRIEDLDREEILRTREIGIQQQRIPAESPADPGDILDRLGLFRAGHLTQAAQVLFGTRFLSDYPQCVLKMGRFRGVTVTGEILDNRQERLHAFDMVREGMAFLGRTLPLRSHFPEGRIERQDRLAIPPAALREILLNAVIHRDYSDPAGYVAIAIFDDRVEIRSIGRLPAGISVESLAGPHFSRLRNPLIAEAFHRTGAVEVWGRGTNRVIEECRRYGLEAPGFREESGGVVVAFRAEIAPTAQVSAQVAAQVTAQVTMQVTTQVAAFCREPKSAKEIMAELGLKHWKTFQTNYLLPLLEAGILERTIPDKPRSRLQKYRTTQGGLQSLKSTDRER